MCLISCAVLSEMEVASCAIIFFLLLLLAKHIRTTSFASSKLPPGPWQLPIIGSMHHLLGSLPHRRLRDLAKKHGPLMHLKLGEVSVVVVSSAAAAKEIMKTHDIDFATRPKLAVTDLLLYGDSHIIFGAYGEIWRQLKKICIVELLSQKRVQSFQYVREQEISGLVRSVLSENGSPFNLSKMLYSMSNDIISRCVIGSQGKDQENFYEAVDEASKATAGLNLADMFPSWPTLRGITGLSHKLGRCHKKLDKSLNCIIDEHRVRREAKKTDDEDLVDLLLRLQQENDLQFLLTNDCIKAVIFDMIAAGSETSANVLEWTITELMKNPMAMRKAQSEVREVLTIGDKPNMSEESMSRLRYLRLVLKENLRVHPPAPMLIPRMCRKTSCVLGLEIPEKTKVLVNAWAIGRDPHIWDDPEEFKPERFEDSPIDLKGLDFELIPFGAGRRICPGMSFGLVTVEQALASLLYYFDWKLPDGVEPYELDITESFGTTTRRKSPLMLCATPYAGLPSEV